MRSHQRTQLGGYLDDGDALSLGCGAVVSYEKWQSESIKNYGEGVSLHDPLLLVDCDFVSLHHKGPPVTIIIETKPGIGCKSVPYMPKHGRPLYLLKIVSSVNQDHYPIHILMMFLPEGVHHASPSLYITPKFKA